VPTVVRETRLDVDRLDSPGQRDPVDIPTINRKLQDVYYEYDRAELTDRASAAVAQDARLLGLLLAEFPTAKVVVEGHCDERGSGEYNLALGDSRASGAAQALREVLRRLGVASARLETVSFGKENPQCTEATESCWQKNRRAHVVVRAGDTR
jgi:peptidoglycan-associated lipoprotein